MTMPAPTVQIDQRWREIIRMSEVPLAPGLFVLGSFARRVTVYAQQRRALNTADALVGTGFLRKETRVAVVGAGFAGLTISAAMAMMGASVSVLDRYSVVAGLQKSCKTRYLHPHIYDWPLQEIESVEAGLPFLSWSAGNADRVVAHVAEQWEDIAKNHSIAHHSKAEVKGLQQVEGGWLLTYDRGKGATEESFDLVILAVGFGVEKPDPNGNSYSYWADLPLKLDLLQRRMWIVSGAGDGALTDVMQLCVRHEDQEGTLRAVVRALHETVPDSVMGRLREKVRRGEGGRELFEEINSATLAASLDLREEEIILNASDKAVFGTKERAPQSSTLNRLVMWMLEKEKKIRLEDGHIVPGGVTSTGATISIELERADKSRRSISCEELLLRHGPEAILPDTAWLQPWSRQLRRLRRQWQKCYDSRTVDFTLEEHPTDSDFAPCRLPPAKASFGAVLVSKHDSALSATFHDLMTRTQVNVSLSEVVGGGGPYTGVEIAPAEALRDARAFSAAVQVFCHAPLALINATQISPALALLIGIRAAVRRGVTLVFHKGEMDMKAWQNLPFNLREVRLVIVTDHHSETGFRSPIIAAIEEGCRRMTRSPARYGDLPGFSSLRNLGASEEETSPRAGKSEVLVLCPFDESYDESWILLRNAIHRHFFPGAPGDCPATRVVDMTSPEMLSRRLFEAIRRDEECVADLTLDSTNVLFELGARLAVHDRGARIIRSSASPPEAEGKLVGEMLGTREYRVGEKGIIEALAMEAPIWPGGTVSASFVHSIAERCVSIDQEAGGQTILDVLWDFVASAGGTDGQKQATPPILFRRNPLVRRNARRFVFDGLIAYCLLAQRLPITVQTKSRMQAAIVEIRNALRDIPMSDQEKMQWTDLLNTISTDISINENASSPFAALVIEAKKERSRIKENREKWKATGNPPELEGEFEAELVSLLTLISTLEETLKGCEPGSLRERDLQAQLAETFGALGALYRDLDKLAEAVSAYEHGATSERRIKTLGGLSGSYCLIQALVNKVLIESRSSDPLVRLKTSLVEAREELMKQLSDDRRGDSWLQADIALITQMLYPNEISDEWYAFEDLLPPSYAYSAAAAVFETLLKALKPHLSLEASTNWESVLSILREG